MGREPPDLTAKCEVCNEPLDYQIGSIKWQSLDHDLCGITRCYKPKCKVNVFMSNICSLGTKSCLVKH